MRTRNRTAATFGGALAVMGVAPELKADVISLDFNPESYAFRTVTGRSTTVDIIGVPGSADFVQWNDPIGKSLFSFNGSVGLVQVSQTLNAGATFGGVTAIGFGFSSTGTAYLGFNSGGNVGWFSMSLGGPQGAITYLEGAYGSMGEAVHVGTVPAPGGLALLALGAAGLRRKRKRAA